MRITRQQLHDLIVETVTDELDRPHNVLTIQEARKKPSLLDAPAEELIEFAAAYASLGAAVQEQVLDLVQQGANADLNPDAVRMIDEELSYYSNEIRDAARNWLRENGF